MFKEIRNGCSISLVKMFKLNYSEQSSISTYLPEISKVLGRLRDPFFVVALGRGVIFLGISPQHGKKIRPELQL